MTGKLLGTFKVGFGFPFWFITNPRSRIEVYEDSIVLYNSNGKFIQQINASTRWSGGKGNYVLDANCDSKLGQFHETVYSSVREYERFEGAVGAAIRAAKS